MSLVPKCTRQLPDLSSGGRGPGDACHPLSRTCTPLACPAQWRLGMGGMQRTDWEGYVYQNVAPVGLGRTIIAWNTLCPHIRGGHMAPLGEAYQHAFQWLGCVGGGLGDWGSPGRINSPSKLLSFTVPMVHLSPSGRHKAYPPNLWEICL